MAKLRPFRFGVICGQMLAAEEWVTKARRPHPPLLVGAGSERMLALAEREANIVGILPKALPAETVLAMPPTFIGTPDQIVEDLLRRREQYGFSYFVVSDANMEAFAPIVNRLADSEK